MQLRDFINYHVETVGLGDTLQQAAQKMRDLDVGSLPVCENNRIVGIVTDRDITIRATASGDDPKAVKVNDVMTPEVISCNENGSVEEAARLMQEHQIRRLFVVNDDQELVGVTSLGELATASKDRVLAGETLERVSESAEMIVAETEDSDRPDSEMEYEDEKAIEPNNETRVTGLFDDSEQAREALEELKDAGFADERIALAMKDDGEQYDLLGETGVRMNPADELANLPDINPGQVLIMVDAEDRVPLALEIINRNHGVPGGVRV